MGDPPALSLLHATAAKALQLGARVRASQAGFARHVVSLTGNGLTPHLLCAQPAPLNLHREALWRSARASSLGRDSGVLLAWHGRPAHFDAGLAVCPARSGK